MSLALYPSRVRSNEVLGGEKDRYALLEGRNSAAKVARSTTPVATVDRDEAVPSINSRGPTKGTAQPKIPQTNEMSRTHFLIHGLRRWRPPKSAIAATLNAGTNQFHGPSTSTNQ